MSYLHDDVVDEDLRSTHPAHRELTLGTGTILAIFVGLVLICGLFFGLGYNMGSKARPETTTAAATEPNVPSPNFERFKPSAGSAGTETKSQPESSKQAVSTSAPYPAAAAAPEPRRNTPAAVAEPAESTPAPAPRSAAAPAPPPHAAPSGPDTIGSFTVQVAAVSHEEDAELLVGALKRKGYAVVARSTPQDKLFHIQIGPFTSKHEAEAMRQRLLGDGYNAILK